MVGEFWSDYGIGMNFVEITIELYLFYYFLKNSGERKPERQVQGSYSLSLALCFLFFGISRVFYIGEAYTSEFFTTFTARILMVCGILAILVVGRVFLSEIIKTDRNRLLYITVGIIFFLTVVPIFSFYPSTRIILVIGGTIYGFPFFFFFIKWIIQFPGRTRKYLSIFLAGMILIVIGQINPGATPAGGNIFIAGLIVISIGAIGLPSLAELDWHKKLQELYILAPQDICFFAYSFVSNHRLDPTPKKDWTQLLIDKYTLHEIGKSLTIALTVKEDLDIIRTKMHLLLEQTEQLYQDVIPRWSGNFKAFDPLKTLIDNIFQ